MNLNEYLAQHGAGHFASDEVRFNAQITVDKANDLLAAFGEARGLRSGWRPADVNAAIPTAAPNSKHITGQAIDIDDPEGDLDEWCMDNQNRMIEIGLWQEHPAATKSWCHVQTVPPKSGKRVFYP